MTQAIVLAGGMATRLYPITKDIPKCLIPFSGRPFVDYQLAWMSKNGVDRVTFILGYLSGQAVSHLKTLDFPSLKIDWIEEGPSRMGTGGAISLALKQGAIKDDFLIVYGDSFLPISFSDVWLASKLRQSTALMTVLHNRGQFDRSNCKVIGNKVALYSKDTAVQSRHEFQHVDYGVTFWTQAAFKEFAPAKDVWDLAEIIEPMASCGKLDALVMDQRFYEIGSSDGIRDFQDLVDGRIDPPFANVINSILPKQVEAT